MSRHYSQPANVDESDFWPRIPGQIKVAVRKVIHWERTDVMSTEEFRERVRARTLYKITSDLRNKTAAGMSFADWRAQIRNLDAFLTRVAKHASIEEARIVLHLRAKKENQAVVAGFDGAIPDVDLLESWSETASAGHELSPAHMVDDSGAPMLRFLGGELRTRDTLEHFRVCADCQSALQLINEQLIDFVVGASNRAINKHHVAVIKRLKLRTGAIQFLLQCRASEDADQATCDRLDGNLGVLGYRRPLRYTGMVCSRHGSSRRMPQRDKFMRTLVEISTLWALLNRKYEATRGPRGPYPVIMISMEDTLSNKLAIGSMALIAGYGRILVKRDRGPALCPL
jgi:hypothetical protein